MDGSWKEHMVMDEHSMVKDYESVVLVLMAVAWELCITSYVHALMGIFARELCIIGHCINSSNSHLDYLPFLNIS